MASRRGLRPRDPARVSFDGGAAGLLAGALGLKRSLAAQVQERADVTIRLSTMVMNHQVARLVLLEQIYRAWTIIKGEPYHH